MNNWETHEAFKKHLCKEIDQLEEQVARNQNMSMQDLEKLDKFYHLKKSMLTADAMEEAEEYQEEGTSGRRGRGANGRYVSRDGGANYAEGYSQGYSEAMSQMTRNQSGHYPDPYYHPMDRRW